METFVRNWVKTRPPFSDNEMGKHVIMLENYFKMETSWPWSTFIRIRITYYVLFQHQKAILNELCQRNLKEERYVKIFNNCLSKLLDNKLLLN